jgi:hypothetical protein
MGYSTLQSTQPASKAQKQLGLGDLSLYSSSAMGLPGFHVSRSPRNSDFYIKS